MPGLDRTGPMGRGSQTGRRMGKCNQKNDVQVEDFPRGRRLGRGHGRRLRFKRDWDSTGDGK